MKTNHKVLNMILPAVFVLITASCSDKELEYTGILDHRPEGKDGMWVIDGKSFSVTADVELDEDDGPITVGTCVGLDMVDGDVREIESEDMEECQAEKS
ncbi:MAG: hypothetical protein JSW45_03325 [Thiotrichales bacterium]|nr:MAG: hypothetical protein JSW45_03325 [Thiotrichales bacterium]